MLSVCGEASSLTCQRPHAQCTLQTPNALLRRNGWLRQYKCKTSWLHEQCQQAGSPCSSSQGKRRARAHAGAVTAVMRGLHPASKAHKRGMLPVSPLHTLAFEVHGNPQGQPVLCVHGGPGAGAYANHARFFDLRHWRVVLVDQRACGASTPRGCLTENTTQALVEDMEALRQHLGIERWVLFGGSWGTTLSLAYALEHTDRVDGLILRAICLMSPPEIDWMYRGGVAALQPKAWADFLAPLPEAEQADPLTAYHQRLTSEDAAVRKAAAGSWLQFDMAAGKVPSQQLQSWNGTAWSQAEPGAGPPHRLPPLKRTATTIAAAGSNGGGSSTNGSGGSTNGSSAPAAAAQASPWQPQPGFGASRSASNGNVSAGGAGSKGGSNGAAAGASPPAQQQGGAAGSSAHKADSNSSGANGSKAPKPPAADVSFFEAQARLEAHYCVNGAFLLDRPILENVESLRGIPAIGIQGRVDLVCPPVTAYRLHKAWPELQLRLVGGAGHSQYDPAIQHELLEATDAMRSRTWAQPASELQVAVY